MDIINLTKKLIRIKSYVDNHTNEKKVADFIFAYLQNQTTLMIKKEFVEAERYNVIAYSPNSIAPNNTFEVDTLFIDHIDTVDPKQGGRYDQFAAIEEDGKLFGLGSVDTKGNVAVLMKLAEIIKDQKCMFLFYVDEEYYFKGIKKFVDDFKTRLRVKKIISADGENLQIRNASRGVLVIDIVCNGKTGHASNPANGVSVIKAFNRLCIALESNLIKRKDSRFGRSSVNIAYVRAGLHRGIKNNIVMLGENGNNIPDYLEAKLEFRLNAKVTLESIVNTIKSLASKERVAITISTSLSEFQPWFTPKVALNFVENALRTTKLPVVYTNPDTSGYVDIGLLQQAFPSVCFCIGAVGKNRHGVNEYVEIASLHKLYDVLKRIIE